MIMMEMSKYFENKSLGIVPGIAIPHNQSFDPEDTLPTLARWPEPGRPNPQNNLQNFDTEAVPNSLTDQTIDTEEVEGENKETDETQPSADEKCLIDIILQHYIKKEDLKVDDNSKTVHEIIKHAVLGYITIIINQMVDLKRKYTFICPTLTGDGNSSITCDKIDCQEIYDQSPFTAEDLFLCFKKMSDNFPVKHIYDQAIRCILEKKKKIKEEEDLMMVETFSNNSEEDDTAEDEAYLFEDLNDCS